MTHARRERLPGWRAGLLVLGLYAMLLQAFFAGLAGPLHAAPGLDPGVICLNSSDAPPNAAQQPASPHQAHDCVCPALCHPGGVLSGAGVAIAAPVFGSFAGATPIGAGRLAGSYQRVSPPARAPPHAGFVLHT